MISCLSKYFMWGNMQAFNKRNICRLILLILTALTIIFIWSNSLENSSDSKQMSDTVVEKVKPIVDPYDKINDDLFVKIVRKLAHFSEFALLGAEMSLLVGMYTDRNKAFFRKALISVGICFVCAVTDELLQLSSEGRSCEFTDMMIDLGGIICGTIFAFILGVIIMKIQYSFSKHSS